MGFDLFEPKNQSSILLFAFVNPGAVRPTFFLVSLFTGIHKGSPDRSSLGTSDPILLSMGLK
ncbi:hypothetical protein H6G81_23275 [Scytonema hofmannii FACHB-248]|uniref:Uncharacterized protein n=1 Tax=Scytonema hofmannii FACHB-248 TaxID=1842502 RepID=A0ABR8GV27_9CYAN|nr:MULTISPECIES: hypothetical protein [Nostocales]MBD2607369.1 hypothetical protein [Scytonema hofmannii FACHB-248]